MIFGTIARGWGGWRRQRQLEPIFHLQRRGPENHIIKRRGGRVLLLSWNTTHRPSISFGRTLHWRAGSSHGQKNGKSRIRSFVSSIRERGLFIIPRPPPRRLGSPEFGRARERRERPSSFSSFTPTVSSPITLRTSKTKKLMAGRPPPPLPTEPLAPHEWRKMDDGDEVACHTPSHGYVVQGAGGGASYSYDQESIIRRTPVSAEDRDRGEFRRKG